VNDRTIVALATASGLGALTVLRLSGPEALRIATERFKSNSGWTPRQSILGRFLDSEDRMLDEGLATFFIGPWSFTGEDVVEFGLHGSPFIAAQAVEALIASGAELAAPGEFTQRAFANGKLDLAQAEAVGDLIAAESRAGHELALKQLKGSVSKRLSQLRRELTDFAALIELELDFVEEDVEFANRGQLLALLESAMRQSAEMLATFRQGQAMRDGIPLVIIGPPNAGKSTLLNRLLRENRALVSTIPGTTRDSVEERFRLGDYVFRLIDTAGIRETSDAVELMGIERSWVKLREAHLVLLLFDPIAGDARDATKLLKVVERENPEASVLLILSKRDLWTGDPTLNFPAHLELGLDDRDLDKLESAIIGLIEANQVQGEVMIANIRHANALRASLEALTRARTSLEAGTSGELVAYDLRDALRHLGSITGEITADDLLSSIFSKFCIGK
jgi:tRNA modification GTPase